MPINHQPLYDGACMKPVTGAIKRALLAVIGTTKEGAFSPKTVQPPPGFGEKISLS